MSEENTQEMEEKQDQVAAMEQVATVSDGREDESVFYCNHTK